MSASLARQLTSQLRQTNFTTGLVDQFQRFMSKKHRIPHRLIIQGVDPEKYTHIPIPYPKTGGRGADGRVHNKRVSGGCSRFYRMIDTTRLAPNSGEPVIEKVLQVRHDALRSAHIALVAKDNHKRWIICSEGVKPGDLIKSYGHIPVNAVQAKLGDSYRIGALPIGAVVHNLETQPNEGGLIARAAGTSALLMKKVEESVLVRMPSGREVVLNQSCIGTYGSVSNGDHNKKHIGSPNRMRWLGIKQRSGFRTKKCGYHGKRMKKKKPMITYDKSVKPTHELF